MKSNRFDFLIEMAYDIWRSGAHLTEVPITSYGRQKGTSKFSRRAILEAAILVWRLGLGASKRRQAWRVEGAEQGREGIRKMSGQSVHACRVVSTRRANTTPISSFLMSHPSAMIPRINCEYSGPIACVSMKSVSTRSGEGRFSPSIPQ